MADDNDKDKPDKPNDPTQAFQNRLNKLNGDAMAFATQLFDENYRLREDKRKLGDEITELKTKVPAEGSVVLSAEKAKDYDSYKTLGKYDDLKKQIDDRAGLGAKVAELEKREIIREVAAIPEFRLNASVLEDRDKAAGGLEFVIKADPKDAKRKVAYVKQEDKEIPLTEFAESNWADYMPSLKVDEGQPKPYAPVDPKPKGTKGVNPEVDKVVRAQARQNYQSL